MSENDFIKLSSDLSDVIRETCADLRSAEPETVAWRLAAPVHFMGFEFSDPEEGEERGKAFITTMNTLYALRPAGSQFAAMTAIDETAEKGCLIVVQYYGSYDERVQNQIVDTAERVMKRKPTYRRALKIEL